MGKQERRHAVGWVLLLVGFMACVSKPEGGVNLKDLDKDVQLDYRVVEHKGSMFGSEVPAMIADAGTMAAQDFAKKYFPESYTFVASEIGQDLDGVKSWAQNFNVQNAVAKRVQTSVDSSFNGLETGTKDELGAAMETFTRVVSQAEFSGLNMENDWWFKRKHYTEEGKLDYTDYQYIVVYSIDKKLLDQQISALLDASISDPANRSAMDKLQQQIKEQGGYGLDSEQI